MLIKEIHLIEGSFEKHIVFDNGINHIFSGNNSCGKTTLIRFILHGLGFAIPDLNQLSMDQCHVKMIIESGTHTIHTSRKDQYITVKHESESKSYRLPRQSNEVLQELFQTDNAGLLECILGAMYIDQDKGWSLLNRGKVIGKNIFDIDKFLSSFTNGDVYALVDKRNALSNELKRYKKLISLFDRQRTLENYSTDGVDLRTLESLQIQLSSEKSIMSTLKKEENRLKHSLDDNKRFLDFVDQMKLVLSVDNKEILLTHDMIVSCPDNLSLIDARLKIIQSRIETSKQLIFKLEEKIDSYIKEKQSETLIESFSVLPISKINLDPIEIQSSIEVMAKSASDLNDEIRQAINSDDAIHILDEFIIRNTKTLKVYEYIENKTPHCFIKDLKKYSGTDYKKIIFAYRLAYNSLIEEKTGIVLPIIVDSPKNEVDNDNLNLMMDLLNRFYRHHQIIVASIDEIPYSDTIIELKTVKRLIDEPRQTHQETII
ncbi:hypothetical protein JS82_07700 [Methanomassiliicoccaceae archaeon DOK]|nr:hypothetical protein JS82_07700 [Methanomassiliicoccaceae archaeon DOK]